MYKNIYFTIALIIFSFVFIVHAYRVFKKEFKNRNVENIEFWGCAFMFSTLATAFTYSISLSFLQSLYENSQIVFWLVFCSVADTLLRTSCSIVHFINYKIEKWLAK